MTTIFTDTLATPDGANQSLSFRNVLTITGASQGQVRATFTCATGNTFNAANCAIGISTGTLSNTTATPVELTFAGAHGFSLTSAQSITSDWVNLSGFTGSDKLVVIVDFAATSGGANACDTASSTAALYGAVTGASYNTAVPGYSLANATYAFVASVETQASGGSPALVAPLTGLGIPRLPLVKPRFPIVLGAAFVPPVVAPLVPSPVSHGIRILPLRKTLPPTLPAALALPASPNVPTLVQSDGSTLNDNNGISGNAYQFNMPNVTLAGNCLVLMIVYPYSASRTVAIADSTGDTWPAAAITQGTTSTGNMRIGIYVLPNASAGLHTLTVTFDASLKPFKYVISEWNNIDTASPVDGTVGVNSVSGSAANAGSFTPNTNNDANGGHLIVGMAISNDTVGTLFANQASAISAANSAQFIDADNTCTIPSASSYLLQATNGAINPGFAFTQSTPTNFVVAAVALKTAAAGQARPAGIRIVRILHVSVVNPQSGNNAIMFPCDGNLRVATMAPGNNLNQVNSVVDTNKTYTDRTSAAGNSQVFEAANTSANNSNVLTLNLNASEPQFSIHLLDIIGADPAPFMNTSGFNGSAPGSGTVFNDFPDHTPNANVAGLTIAQTGMGTAGPQFGFAAGAPSGAIFNNVYYAGDNDQDRMDNADPFGHVYFSTNTLQTWNWLLGSAGWGSTAFATAVSYKAAAGTTTSVTADFGGWVEFLGSIRSDATALLESLASARSDAAALLEYLASVHADSVAQIEAIAAVRRDGAGLPEIVEGLSAGIAAQLECLGSMRGDNLGAMEMIAAMRADVMVLTEALSGRQSDIAAASEILAGLRADLVGPLENLGGVSVTADAAMPIELIAKVSFDRVAGLEAITAARVDLGAPAEIVAGMTRQVPAPVEVVLWLQGSIAAPIENLGGILVLANAAVPIEAIGKIGVDQTAGVEVLAGLRSDAALTIETLASMVSSSPTGVEALASMASTGPVSIEVVARFQSHMTARFEFAGKNITVTLSPAVLLF